MTQTNGEGRPPGGRDAPGNSPGNSSCLDSVDGSLIAPKTAPAQAEILRDPRAVREAKLELLREAVHEACGFIRIHAEVCQTLAEAGDDAGMVHSLARLVAYAKHAEHIGSELRAVREAAP